MAPRPSDPELYNSIKARLYAEMPTHSAYRSGLLVQRYKKAGGTYEGSKPKPKDGGLARWYREAWQRQDGGIGYRKKGDLYRPSVRVNADTPTTWKELKPSEVARARTEKKATGRVSSFKK